MPDAGFSQVTHRNPGSRVGNDEQVVVAQAPHQDPPGKLDKYIIMASVIMLRLYKALMMTTLCHSHTLT